VLLNIIISVVYFVTAFSVYVCTYVYISVCYTSLCMLMRVCVSLYLCVYVCVCLQQFSDVGRDEYRVCERLVHDQHLQHQGWAAVIANLDDITR